jgi:hypothetical protein
MDLGRMTILSQSGFLQNGFRQNGFRQNHFLQQLDSGKMYFGRMYFGRMYFCRMIHYAVPQRAIRGFTSLPRPCDLSRRKFFFFFFGGGVPFLGWKKEKLEDSSRVKRSILTQFDLWSGGMTLVLWNIAKEAHLSQRREYLASFMA